MSGTLSVCGTPIGNLADATPRVVEALRAAAVVACEDTRRTAKLLAAYGIAVPLVRLDETTEARQAPRLAVRAARGARVCLVSDAGMPAIADPGRTLIAAALAAGVRVEVLPGPSAVTTAIVASGLAADRFAFAGFLPRSAAALAARLDELDGWRVPLVCFEAPGRLPRTLAAIAARAPQRPVAVCRELTKLHEDVARGTAAEIAALYAEPPRGEVTLVLGALPPDAPVLSAHVREALDELRASGVPARRAAAIAARLTGIERRTLYDAMLPKSPT